MGAKHSKGSTRAEVEAVLPRSWSELEHFYARYQQEVFRRKASDAQCQFFLTFPVFRSVVSARAAAAAIATSDAGDVHGWDEKERLLRAFQYLDKNRRQRIATIDFFAGLALVTNAKKAVKFEFLFSLLDNGGIKTLNACEVTMILAAAGRGLALFKAIPPVTEESLRPLTRRLLGEARETARVGLVEKALTDPEIVFFMNDLENETATTSDALLVQQSRLMKSVAASELQFGRAEAAQRGSSYVNRRAEQPLARSPGLTRPARELSSETILRRLQAALLPLPPQPLGVLAGRDIVRASTTSSNALKRISGRTLCRLVETISDGSLKMASIEADHIVSTIHSDQFGFVKSNDILRCLRSWVAKATMRAVPPWQLLARSASDGMKALKMFWAKWAADERSKPQFARSTQSIVTQTSGGAEISYNLKARIGPSTTKLKDAASRHEPTSEAERLRLNSALGFRARIHHGGSEQEGSPVLSGGTGGIDPCLAIVFEFRLKHDLTDEEAIDITFAAEQFLTDDEMRRHLDFAVETCQATVVESQLPRSNQDAVVPRCLRLRFPVTINLFELFETKTGCKLSRLVRNAYVSVDLNESLEEIITEAKRVVESFPNFVKQDERTRLLSDLFAQFDDDNDGLWCLKEFNQFQQAIKESALEDSAFLQCFGARREISLRDFINAFQSSSADDFRVLLEHLGSGSISSQLSGLCTVNATMDEYQLKQLESSLSSFRSCDSAIKWVSFMSRSFVDFSCDFHCRSIVDFLQTLGVDLRWRQFLSSATTLARWTDALRAFVSPKHNEHERDFVCRSMFCYLEDELSKTTQQLEMEDQQRNLPQGTSARLATVLRKAHGVAVLFRECVDGLESVSLESPQMRVSCEIDNFNLLAVLRSLQ